MQNNIYNETFYDTQNALNNLEKSKLAGNNIDLEGSYLSPAALSYDIRNQYKTLNDSYLQVSPDPEIVMENAVGNKNKRYSERSIDVPKNCGQRDEEQQQQQQNKDKDDLADILAEAEKQFVVEKPRSDSKTSNDSKKSGLSNSILGTPLTTTFFQRADAISKKFLKPIISFKKNKLSPIKNKWSPVKNNDNDDKNNNNNNLENVMSAPQLHQFEQHKNYQLQGTQSTLERQGSYKRKAPPIPTQVAPYREIEKPQNMNANLDGTYYGIPRENINDFDESVYCINNGPRGDVTHNNNTNIMELAAKGPPTMAEFMKKVESKTDINKNANDKISASARSSLVNEFLNDSVEEVDIDNENKDENHNLDSDRTLKSELSDLLKEDEVKNFGEQMSSKNFSQNQTNNTSVWPEPPTVDMNQTPAELIGGRICKKTIDLFIFKRVN